MTQPVAVGTDGRRHRGANDLALTDSEVKTPYAYRSQVEETVRLLKQECGRGGCPCRKHRAQGAHLHLKRFSFAFTKLQEAPGCPLPSTDWGQAVRA